MEDLILLFPIWLILSVFTGIYAKRIGRSSIFYTLFALLLSPLLTICILLLLGPNIPTMEKNRLATGLFKLCPHCAESVKKAAVVCRCCGRDLPVPSENNDGARPAIT